MIKQSTKTHFILQTKSLLFLPYCRQFVKQYHEWFSKDPQLLRLTGSEPLTLEQEYENHKSWLQDTTKYTFIIFTKGDEGEKKLMIGDVNLFFSEWIEANQAELNLMIAVKEERRKGYGEEILKVIQLFAQGVYGKDFIIAKIKDDNEPSIKFFQKHGYTFQNHNKSFQQKEFHKKSEHSSEEALKILTECYKMRQFEQKEKLFS